MRNSSFKFTQVTICSNSVAQRLDSANSSFLRQKIKGNLHVMLEVASGMLLFQMNAFTYGVNPNDQIVYDNSTDEGLVLCLNSQPDNRWILKIRQNKEMILEILQQRCKLVQKAAGQVMNKQMQANSPTDLRTKITEKIKADYKKFWEGWGEESKQAKTGQQLGYVNQQLAPDSIQVQLVETSLQLGNGLKYLGKFLSQKFLGLGNQIANRVQPADAIQVSDGSKKMISKSLNASKKTLQFTQQQIAKIFRMGVGQVHKIDAKYKAPQEAQKGNYDFARDKLKTGLHILFNVYDGFSQGMDEATKGLAEGSRNVVDKKYGKQMGDATFDVAQGARNIYKVYKIPTKGAKQVLNPHGKQYQDKVEQTQPPKKK